MSEIEIISNPSALTAEDLIDEYGKISQWYLKLKENVENCEQQIFQLKRNVELSEKRETYLCQELESITESHEKELDDTKHNHNIESQDLRTRLKNITQLNGELENEVDHLKSEMAAIELKSKIKAACECGTKMNESIISNSRFEYFEKLENDRMTMLHDMDDLKEKLMDSMQKLARSETELGNVKDCFECSQENLNSKNQELDEKSQMIDLLQEKIVELNAELAEYKSGNNEPNKKGNSLFAEVDDQRQHMKQILAQQKQQYSKMKREHQEGQLKIRRLQRENSDMHREVQQCSQMLQDANHYYKESLNNTIGFLESEVSQLREKLILTESRLVAVAKEKKVTWLESMLEYCKKETKILKDQLYMTRLQKCEAERFYIESKEQAARWRFEALKSRCLIVDREMLLEQHNIPFGPLAKIGNIVEKLYKDGSGESPNISDIIPLTSLSGIELASSMRKNDDMCSKSSLQSSFVLLPVEENAQEEMLSTTPPTIGSNISKAGACDLQPAQIRTEYLTAYDDTIILEQEPNKENKTNNCNANAPQSVLSTVAPQFRPISIPSERMKVLGQSLVEVDIHDGEKSSSSQTIQKNLSKSRPKLVVKHIVLKRE